MNTKNILYKMCGIMHFILFVITAIYIFIFPNKIWIDILYILYFLFVNIHWVFLDGECIVAYIYNKFLDKSYKRGSEPSKNQDIMDLFNNIIDEKYIHIIILLLLILYLYNVFFVLKRNNFNLVIISLVIISYIIYITLMRIKANFAKKYSYVHLIIYLFTLIYYMKKF
jgi:hypothetical protein